MCRNGLGGFDRHRFAVHGRGCTLLPTIVATGVRRTLPAILAIPLARLTTIGTRAFRPSTLVAIGPATPAILLTIAVILAIAVAFRTLVAAAALLLGTDRLTFVAVILVEIEIVLRTTLPRLILIAAALIGEDAEVVIGELEVIFRVDAIALPLRVRRHVLVLFVKLAGVATCPAVDPIAIVTLALAASALRTLPTTATTATVLTVVDQNTVLVLKPKTALLPEQSVQQPPGFGGSAQIRLASKSLP